MRNEKYGKAVWVGIIDPEGKGNWTFLNGSPITELLTEWHPDQPDNRYGCARFWNSKNNLYDWPCGFTSATFCQTIKYHNLGVDKCVP